MSRAALSYSEVAVGRHHSHQGLKRFTKTDRPQTRQKTAAPGGSCPPLINRKHRNRISNLGSLKPDKGHQAH